MAKKTAKTKEQDEPPRFPSASEILRFIEESPTPVGKREIARAFKIKGADRPRLKEVLRELKQSGELERHSGRQVASPGRLPEVAVIEVVELDEDGELLARPANWKPEQGAPPKIYVVPDNKKREALAPGERLLAKLRRDDEDYQAKVIRRLGKGGPLQVLGIYEPGHHGGRLKPVDKKAKKDFLLAPEDAAGAEPGELVLAEAKGHHRRMGLRDVRVIERHGSLDNHHALSLISIHEQGLPTVFPEAAIVEAENAKAVQLNRRTDLRALPLVTIDGADARDFDDAVFAEPDDRKDNPGGWHLIVAIADVAHYVRPDSALDREAYKRGNSAYFPDRVVPMLPEALSNGWCSLNPEEDRGCLAAHLWIGKDGKLKDHRFERGLLRSAARLTYEEVQEARNGFPNDQTAPLQDQVIAPLYGAFEALLHARKQRGTLDLDVPERQVVFGEDGQIAEISTRERLDSHRLIEEFMITANVAAARELEARKQPCMYRVHEPPDPVKVEALREVLQSMDLSLPRGQSLRPRDFTGVLEKVSDGKDARVVSELVLRSQSQAYYSPENLGHFGLALDRYAHFTSPIRRYSDLIVHRALIDGLKLGKDGLPKEARELMQGWGEHISYTERRAVAAERDAKDRMAAAFLSNRIGEVFEARISSVTRFGLFVSFLETGADALIPISSLPDDYYHHDEKRHALIGRRWGREYHLGEHHAVRLVEAEGVTGSLIGEVVEGGESGGGGAAPKKPAKPSGRGKPVRKGAKGKNRLNSADAKAGRGPKKGGKAGKPGKRGKKPSKSRR